jgi:CheY-like chemotaxis protein
MTKNGPIIVIEDDPDDQEMLHEVFKNLNFENEIHFFGDGTDALNYLYGTKPKPFLILSDINLPKLNGLELRDKIKNDADLALRCIPYLFFSSASNQQTVIDAYSKSVQGFFVKPNSMGELQEVINTIVQYWKKCTSPNSF